MMQAWYNTTKEAILNAEKERKRKGLDAAKLMQEMEESEDYNRVNVKKFSIESYESWKEDLMKCGGGEPNQQEKLSNELLFKSGSAYSSKDNPTKLLPVPEEDQDKEPETSTLLSTSVEATLSTEDRQGLAKMEKATPIINEEIPGSKMC